MQLNYCRTVQRRPVAAQKIELLVNWGSSLALCINDYVPMQIRGSS